ncbi:MAG: hypothetical protein ABEI78_02025 [Candidatus Nanohaloarchaea archaeon]
MIAGLILKDSNEKESKIAFLEDELTTHSVKNNQEIVDLIAQNTPEILAINVGKKAPEGNLTEEEQELQEEGYQFTPSSHKTVERRRLEALENHIFEELGQEKPDFIRFDPFISIESLALHSDDALRSYGVDPSDISNSEEFDAAVGAITARFYQSGQYKSKGLIIPEPLEENED